MNLTPLDILNPVFHFLDDAIADYGVYLYLALVWLSAILIAWMFRSCPRRKTRPQPREKTRVVIIVEPPKSLPPPKKIQEPGSVSDDIEV